MHLRVIFLLSGLLISGMVQAQMARETFGKNRIQFKDFDWNFISSDNFDVYYYGDRYRVASETVQYLESEFDRITDLIGYPPYLKTKVFLYNSFTDLLQSNMGLTYNRFTANGETNFIKPYVEVAHPGTLTDFKQELLLKVSDLMVNEMMFGGSLKDMFQNSVLLNLPEWFIDGASQYIAYGWSIEMDDYVRQVMKKKSANRALKSTGKDAALVGQSIWNYIVEKYGKSSISNILNYTRIIRNEQKSILITLGVPYKKLIADWEIFYSTMEQRVSQIYQPPADSLQFSPRHRSSLIYTTVKLSPDGRKIAYAENDRGRFTVKVKSVENDQESTILSGGNRVIHRDVDYRVPLLSWADANTLGVIVIRNGDYVFWLYDLNTRSKIPRELGQYSNIRSLNFNSNGRLAVISADVGGQNDLFLLSSRRDRTRRLTNDIFDDLDPAFVPNSSSIIFSSNRTTDTLINTVRGHQNITENYNLFMLNLDSGTAVGKRITNTLSKDFSPRAQDANNIYYLSDQRGIINLFRFNAQTGIYSQLTNFSSSIKDYDLNFQANMLAMVMDKDLTESIFLNSNFNFDRQIFTPSTRRKEIQQARVLTEKRKKEPEQKMSIKDLINQRLREKKDTTSRPAVVPVAPDTVRRTPGEINTDDYRFEDPPAPKADMLKPVKKDTLKAVSPDQFVFEDEAVKKPQPTETFLTRYMRARENGRVQGPFPYKARFSYENLVTNFVVDQLRGFSMRVETQMNDMLENFQIFGGIQTAFDFRSGDVFGEFQYTKHRVDLSVRFDRKVVFWDTEMLAQDDMRRQKYAWQKLEFGASLPLTVRTRVSLKPFLGYTRFTDQGSQFASFGPPTFLPTQQQFYAGTRVEAVYDNSLTTGMNIIEGTRGKISAINYQALGNNQKSFSQVFIDVRHYQKIYKEIVFAVRGYAGTFFGNSPKKYLLGGIDNWFGNTLNTSGQNNPMGPVASFNENLLFAEFATTLRGFDYGTLFGNSVAIASAELRLPLIRALSGGPISSNFFRNMQFIGFYDIGSSWTGPVPINTRTNIRNRIVPEDTSGSPFVVEIKDYLNPWLYSYGVGFRSMMLGYYLKLDVAWPVENYQVKDPRFMVSLGFDF
jgi:Tol biopolymer transport system component